MTTGTLTTTRPTDVADLEAPPARRRRRWVFVLAVFATCAGALGYLVGNEVQSNTQFDQAHASLDLTRHHLEVVRADLTSVRRKLHAVDRQVNQTSTSLSSDTAQLQQAQAALALAQTNVTHQGSDITALQSCLGGVEQALNALSVGDAQTAVNALNTVSSSCQSAVAANG